jgi:potassium-transporting ATPase ATP-binding subunit
MLVTRHVALARLLTGVLRELHPGQANRRPALFMLEVVAALLSVLALRNGILGGPAVSFETQFAVGLWGTLLAIACGFTIRGRDQAQTR